MKTSKSNKTTKVENTNEVKKVYLSLICVDCMNLMVFKYCIVLNDILEQHLVL